VAVATQLGQGSTFRVFLPALPVPVKEAPPPPATTALRGGGETILLVEDEPPVRMIMRRLLEMFHYKVLEAASGREALEVWAKHGHGIAPVLTDIAMPEVMTGRELAQKLRVTRPGLRVIFMSGYRAEAMGRDAEFLRADKSHFHHKPCSTDSLLRTVRQCLDEP
jgi:CheY-like chemotaxis protein